ncbi:MAG TPA: hypothetical protein VK524_03985 [Polyangiaceae bacterium]|nr:hypothetical protein [Polyangiaceae bacterium]
MARATGDIALSVFARKTALDSGTDGVKRRRLACAGKASSRFESWRWSPVCEPNGRTIVRLDTFMVAAASPPLLRAGATLVKLALPAK